MFVWWLGLFCGFLVLVWLVLGGICVVVCGILGWVGGCCVCDGFGFGFGWVNLVCFGFGFGLVLSWNLCSRWGWYNTGLGRFYALVWC